MDKYELILEGRVGTCSDAATQSSWPVLLEPEVQVVSATDTRDVSEFVESSSFCRWEPTNYDPEDVPPGRQEGSQGPIPWMTEASKVEVLSVVDDGDDGDDEDDDPDQTDHGRADAPDAETDASVTDGTSDKETRAAHAMTTDGGSDADPRTEQGEQSHPDGQEQEQEKEEKQEEEQECEAERDTGTEPEYRQLTFGDVEASPTASSMEEDT